MAQPLTFSDLFELWLQSAGSLFVSSQANELRIGSGSAFPQTWTPTKQKFRGIRRDAPQLTPWNRRQLPCCGMLW